MNRPEDRVVWFEAEDRVSEEVKEMVKSEIGDLERMLATAGFKDIKIAPKDSSRAFIREWLPGKGIEEYLISATIEAVKP